MGPRQVCMLNSNFQNKCFTAYLQESGSSELFALDQLLIVKSQTALC